MASRLTRRAASGSSPRGRGKRHRHPRRTQHRGLIPARAGKTTYQPYIEGQSKAHPRAGGENPVTRPRRASLLGSSPRGRGKPAGGLVVERWERAHPRAGGENPRSHSTRHEQKGSSPRGRGKPALSCRPRGDRRLIPARAGKTSVNGRTACARTAHPRAGGENGQPVADLIISIGSSPRGRGKRRRRDQEFQPSRLIPARAGKT